VADSAIYGEHQGNGIGVFGRGGLNGGEGVFGQTGSGSSGVHGKNEKAGNGVTGESDSGVGVSGFSIRGEGVLGASTQYFGVHGIGGDSPGVYGECEFDSGVEGRGAFGVSGKSDDHVGVSGFSRNAIGVSAEGGDYAITAERISGAGETAYLCVEGLAGEFFGNVSIHGQLMKQSGGFKIDHVLDPSNKYLCHSFVESPDMLNVYSGNVQLNERGEATVTLPEWFEVLNEDYVYQLTAIGASAPGLFIAREIYNNSFAIAGGGPSMKVCWQITGVRRDPYAKAHRIRVEEEKPASEKGSLLNPELHSAGSDRGLKTIRSKAVHHLKRKPGKPRESDLIR
jgi:hypothetical protein